jgi:hypothetical protein
MTSIRRSSRIASQPTGVRYRKDGSSYLFRKQNYDSEYVSRMAAFVVARGSSAIMKAVFELFRYAISNPLPVKHSPRLRLSLIILLSSIVRDFSHPMVITITDRYLDCMEQVKTHSDYVPI